MSNYVFLATSIVNDEIYGIQRNTFELLNELDLITNKGQIEIVVPKGSKKSFDFKNIKVTYVNLFKDKFKNPLISKLLELLWINIKFKRYAHNKSAISVDTILGLPLLGCDVVMVYDCIRELFPENAKSKKEKLSRMIYMIRVKNCIKNSKLVLTDSYSAKNDIINMYHCDEDKIKVIYCGWQHFERIAEDKSAIEKYNLTDCEYFFSLGSRAIHKNFKWIAEAAKQNPQYKFVVSGSNLLNSSDSFLDNEKLPNLIFTGYLKDEEIKALMHYCKAFIQPSLYEGFGIPPMEAMSTGAKCIVSNVASLPEIYGESVWYIDPYNYENIDIDSLIIKELFPKEDILNRFSWKNSAKNLSCILKEIYGFQGEVL